MIQETIWDTLLKGLVALGIFSDFRSTLQVLCSRVPRYRVVAKIRRLVKDSGIKVHLHWIIHTLITPKMRAQMRWAKLLQLVPRPMRRFSPLADNLRGNSLAGYLLPGSVSMIGIVTYMIFHTVSTWRLHGDFYVNQVLSHTAPLVVTHPVSLEEILRASTGWGTAQLDILYICCL